MANTTSTIAFLTHNLLQEVVSKQNGGTRASVGNAPLIFVRIALFIQ